MHNIIEIYALAEPYVNFIKGGTPLRLLILNVGQLGTNVS